MTNQEELERIVKEKLDEHKYQDGYSHLECAIDDTKQASKDIAKAILSALFPANGGLREALTKLIQAVRAYADIGGKVFNQDEKEFWAMCEVNDGAEKLLKQALASSERGLDEGKIENIILPIIEKNIPRILHGIDSSNEVVHITTPEQLSVLLASALALAEKEGRLR